MAGLLYYLPGKQSARLEELRAGELGYAFERESDLVPRPVQGGPDQADGLIVADGRSLPAGRVGFYAEKQTWLRIPGSENWVGMYSADRPTPAELARGQMLPGHGLVLGDDQEWEIPVARGWVDDEDSPGAYQALPATTTLDAEGNWISGGVLAQYERLWDLALKWWDAFIGAAVAGEESSGADSEKVEIRFEFADLADGAVSALAANYRVSRVEVSLLGLLTNANMREVLDRLIDRPTLETWLKKKPEPIAPNPTAAG